ncbi:MAG: hypothetical protein ACK41Y_16715, partial [Paracoccus hibiscisoli]|uniref:hypothetical protein n=1 Tax=Paracoccus hibiscisoli TaxID=2023261 RepID=UPI00391BF916
EEGVSGDATDPYLDPFALIEQQQSEWGFAFTCLHFDARTFSFVQRAAHMAGVLLQPFRVTRRGVPETAPFSTQYAFDVPHLERVIGYSALAADGTMARAYRQLARTLRRGNCAWAAADAQLMLLRAVRACMEMQAACAAAAGLPVSADVLQVGQRLARARPEGPLLTLVTLELASLVACLVFHKLFQ